VALSALGLSTLKGCLRDSPKARHQGAKRSHSQGYGEHLQRRGRAFDEIARRAGLLPQAPLWC